MKISLLGTGNGWELAPKEGEIWCVPGLHGRVSPTRVYEVHSGQTLASVGMSQEKLEWMKAQSMVVHPSLHNSFPNCRVIDFQKHIDKFGPYFTSSLSWMLAEAIEENPEEIGIYGVSMCSQTEYAHQKPGCTYLIGWARALGIKVTIPPTSELLAAPYIYGMQDKPAMITAIENRKKEIIKNKDKAEDDWVLAKANFHHQQGALEAFEFFENNWWAGGKK